MKSALSRSAKPPPVKRTFTLKPSETDWERLHSSETSPPTKAHPESQLRHVVRGIVRHGLKSSISKTSVSLRVDQDVIAWFKAQGSGYQTRINLVLKAFRDASASSP